MTRFAPRTAAAVLLALLALPACAAAQPAAGAAPRTPAAAPAPGDSARPRHTAADVRFMQHMIGHHAQALTMAALVPTHTRRPEMRLLAERIDVSQRDEIALMRRWLQDRGAAPEAGSPHDHHGADAGAMGAAPAARMPGMLTDEELARLAQTTGPAFDRLFLECMIRHHEGAITMVAELFATPGAGQDVELFRFASDVDADQRAEIQRMRALLAAWSSTAPRR